EHPNIVPYGTIFATGDGSSLVVAVGTERQFRAFAAAVGRPELADDPRFATNSGRVAHRRELNEELRATLALLPGAEVADRLRRDKVPFGTVNDMAAVFAQPQSRAQLFADGRGVRSVSLVGAFEGRRDLAPPPHLDQHRAEILAELDR
ncbi:MAG: CoA transferase, partial [Thermoanaerobaculia bacterium]|nr:CoA transferase [Thermoanaerobaculia bacterium]